MIIKHTKTILSIAAAAMIPFAAAAATKTITTDEEWYDPRDWFDGDDVDYETVEVDETETNTYGDNDSLNRDQNVYATNRNRDESDELDLDDDSYATTRDKSDDLDLSDDELDLDDDSYATTQQRKDADRRIDSEMNRRLGDKKQKDSNLYATTRTTKEQDADDLEYVYLSYIIVPAKDGKKEWNEKGISQQVARNEYEKAEQDEEREYVRGEEKSSAKDKKSSKISTLFQKKSDRMNLRGEIAAFSTIDIEGESKDNDLIKIELENGKTAVVDLGSDSAREDLELDEGDKILVRGTKDELDGKVILVAEEVTVGNASKKSDSKDDHKMKHSDHKMNKMNKSESSSSKTKHSNS